MTGDDLTQQLAEQTAWRVADVSGWPDWMQVPALGRDITPVVARVLDAALASGLVVPTSDVLKKISDWEHRLPARFVREMRALVDND